MKKKNVYFFNLINIFNFLLRFKCLLRNDSDEPFSKTLFDNIERTLYYIETQLTHVDDQLKARYDSYNPNNK